MHTTLFKRQIHPSGVQYQLVEVDFDVVHSQHEEMSLKMFDHLLANNPALRPAFTAFVLQSQDVELVKDLIVGRNAAARPANKRFLFDVSEGNSLVTRQEMSFNY